MRKILLGVISALIIGLLVISMKNGIKIGSFQVLSVQELKDQSDSLTQNIENANSASENYESALKKLTTDISTMTKAKKDYLDLVTVSTDSEIEEATQTKNYTIEYLWSRVGNHATEEGVTLKMDVTQSNMVDSSYNNLKFIATGNYLAITNFIYSLENDSKLDFTIDDFDMTNGQATFTVKDVKIQSEKTTATISTNSQNATTTGSTTSKTESTTSTTGNTNTTTKQTTNTTSSTSNSVNQ